MKILWVVVTLLFSYGAMGQAELLSKKGSKYYYKEKEYECKELSVVYADHNESMNFYTSGRSNIRAANMMTYVGLGFIVIGVGMASGGRFDRGIAGGFSIAAGLLLEIIGLIPRGIGKGKLSKAMKTFNFEMIERHGYNADQSLSFGMTGNGIGLVYQF